MSSRKHEKVTLTESKVKVEISGTQDGEYTERMGHSLMTLGSCCHIKTYLWEFPDGPVVRDHAFTVKVWVWISRELGSHKSLKANKPKEVFMAPIYSYQ